MNGRYPDFSVSDYGELTACGDIRVISAANFLSLQDAGMELKSDGWEKQQAQLVCIVEDHQISVDALQAILDWHKRENMPDRYEADGPTTKKRDLDFWTQVAIYERDKKLPGESDPEGEDQVLADKESVLIGTLDSQVPISYYK